MRRCVAPPALRQHSTAWSQAATPQRAQRAEGLCGHARIGCRERRHQAASAITDTTAGGCCRAAPKSYSLGFPPRPHARMKARPRTRLKLPWADGLRAGSSKPPRAGRTALAPTPETTSACANETASRQRIPNSAPFGRRLRDRDQQHLRARRSRGGWIFGFARDKMLAGVHRSLAPAATALDLTLETISAHENTTSRRSLPTSTLVGRRLRNRGPQHLGAHRSRGARSFDGTCETRSHLAANVLHARRRPSPRSLP